MEVYNSAIPVVWCENYMYTALKYVHVTLCFSSMRLLSNYGRDMALFLTLFAPNLRTVQNSRNFRDDSWSLVVTWSLTMYGRW